METSSRFSLLSLVVVGFTVLSPNAIADEASGRGSIWKVSDEDSTVYLAGSVHLLREEDLPIPEAYDRVYAEAEEVVFEIDMALMMRPGAAEEMKRLGALPAGVSLEDRFGAETMERLRGYLKENGRRPDLFDRFAPGMVFLMLSSLEAARHGAKAELGLETRYFRKSVADGKPSRGLETIAYQVSRLNGMEKTAIEELINESLDRLEEGEETLDAIIGAWRSGDAEGLEEILLDESNFSPELRRLLLTDRNRNWIPEIEKALAADYDVLFLVGAAHLVGEDSVVALLREKGLEVTQVGDR